MEQEGPKLSKHDANRVTPSIRASLSGVFCPQFRHQLSGTVLCLASVQAVSWAAGRTKD